MRQRFRNKRRRIERQEEAAERQASYDALSLPARLAMVDARSVLFRGDSFRERDRLTALITDGDSIGGVRLA